MRKASESSVWRRVPPRGPWAETPEEAVFPEAGPSLRGMGPGRREVLQELDPTDPSFASLSPSRGNGASLPHPL